MKKRLIDLDICADSDDTESVVKATVAAVIKGLKIMVASLEADIGGPGMTWAQLLFFLDEFGKKQPVIITADEQ